MARDDSDMGNVGKIISFEAFRKRASGSKPSSKRDQSSRFALFTQRSAQGWLMILSTALALAVMMTPRNAPSVPVPPVGSIAPYKIKAPADALVGDKESTEKNRRQAAEAALDIYDFDVAAEKELTLRVREAFGIMSAYYMTHARHAYVDVVSSMELFEENGKDFKDPKVKKTLLMERKKLLDAEAQLAAFEHGEAYSAAENEFLEKLGVGLSPKDLETARQYHYWPQMGEMALLLTAPSLSKGVVARKGGMPNSSAKGIKLRNLSTGGERVIRNFDEIYDIPEAYKKIKEDAATRIPDKRPSLRRLATEIAQKLIEPNVTFNRKETDMGRDLAASEAKPVFFHIQRGEMIVREGETVTQAHVEKLAQIAGRQENRGWFKAFFGLFTLSLLLVALAATFLTKFHEDIAEYPKLQLLLAGLLVSHMGMLWVSHGVSSMFLPQTPRLDISAYMLAAPLAFGPMIVSIFFTMELTAFFSVIAAAFTLLLFRDMPALALLTITSGLICAWRVRRYQRRSSVIKAGLYVAATNVLVVAAFDMAGTQLFSVDQLFNPAFAAGGGILMILLVSGALPVIESLFPVVSDIKLLELASLDHPLLRRMIMEASGTYQHSMMVGNLAEEACKDIGANALLARAGALFHDIGKMKIPDYFAENQRSGVNPHDKLSPYMSARIVLNHIKEGMELAKQ
ncbi:MAG: HDIG domain-containing protein, partial [Nitrospinae bacterium]|nr:HDIG domain-containing protein [Nitrospinota bacterium]